MLCGIVVAILHVSHRQAIGSPWVYPWISTKKSVDMDVDMDGKFHIHGKPGTHLPYGITYAIRDKWTHPALTPSRQVGTRLTYPGGMEGWVYLGGWVARNYWDGRYPSVGGLTIAVCNQLNRSTQPGHPSVGRFKNWGVNKHTRQCSSPISVVLHLQCKPVSG